MKLDENKIFSTGSVEMGKVLKFKGEVETVCKNNSQVTSLAGFRDLSRTWCQLCFLIQ